jgi:hypothetical protein
VFSALTIELNHLGPSVVADRRLAPRHILTRLDLYDTCHDIGLAVFLHFLSIHYTSIYVLCHNDITLTYIQARTLDIRILFQFNDQMAPLKRTTWQVQKDNQASQGEEDIDIFDIADERDGDFESQRRKKKRMPPKKTSSDLKTLSRKRVAYTSVSAPTTYDAVSGPGEVANEGSVTEFDPNRTVVDTRGLGPLSRFAQVEQSGVDIRGAKPDSQAAEECVKQICKPGLEETSSASAPQGKHEWNVTGASAKRHPARLRPARLKAIPLAQSKRALQPRVVSTRSMTLMST